MHLKIYSVKYAEIGIRCINQHAIAKDANIKVQPTKRDVLQLLLIMKMCITECFTD